MPLDRKSEAIVGASSDAAWHSVVDADPTWNSWSGIHGRYLAAALGEGAAALAPGHALRALHVLFLKPATAARVDLRLRRSRIGRAAAFLEGEARAGGDDSEVVLRAQVLTGAAGPGPRYASVPAPVVPDPGECAPFDFPVALVPFTQHLEIRPANDARPLAGGDQAELIAWIRLRIGELNAAQALVVLNDALPPALYAVLDQPVAIPSADLSVHLTPLAASADPTDWFLVRIATEAAGEGWSVDGSQVWDRRGALLSVGRQMRRVLA